MPRAQSSPRSTTRRQTKTKRSTVATDHSRLTTYQSRTTTTIMPAYARRRTGPASSIANLPSVPLIALVRTSTSETLLMPRAQSSPRSTTRRQTKTKRSTVATDHSRLTTYQSRTTTTIMPAYARRRTGPASSIANLPSVPLIALVRNLCSPEWKRRGWFVLKMKPPSSNMSPSVISSINLGQQAQEAR